MENGDLITINGDLCDLMGFTYLDGPWEKRDSWLVTGDWLPPKNPTEIIHLLTS